MSKKKCHPSFVQHLWQNCYPKVTAHPASHGKEESDFQEEEHVTQHYLNELLKFLRRSRMREEAKKERGWGRI